ncbi:MAG: peroxiredoxin [Cyanobacteria bacterium REEB417]|nr:peroxiredoxin [Cyanobacteria bacterium REEB417]
MFVDQLPSVTFRTRVRDDSIPGDNPFRWQDRTTEDVFAGRRSILFSLPAAFSPTCSDQHVPRYEALAVSFKALGIDQIVCVAVNDAFVMFQWGKKVGVQQVHLLPDGNGEFTRLMGMLVDRSKLGMGLRSWRYSLLLDGLRIEKAFVEAGLTDNAPGDPLEVSDADTMLAYLQRR